MVDVRAKIINQDTIISYSFDDMKKMINSDDSDENYNNYKLPNINEEDIVEIMYTVKKDINFNGNKIIEESQQLDVIVDTRDGLTRGQTIVDYFGVENKHKNIRVVTKANKKRFMDLLIKSLQ